MLSLSRLLFVLGGLTGALAVAYAAGVRQGLLVLLGIGFGAVLQGARFGFTTGACGRRCCCSASPPR